MSSRNKRAPAKKAAPKKGSRVVSAPPAKKPLLASSDDESDVELSSSEREEEVKVAPRPRPVVAVPKKAKPAEVKPRVPPKEEKELDEDLGYEGLGLVTQSPETIALVNRVVAAACKGADGPVLAYVSGVVLDDVKQTHDELVEAVGHILLAYDIAGSDAEARGLCAEIVAELRAGGVAGRDKPGPSAKDAWQEATEATRAQLKDGVRVQALYYDDGEFYPGVVREVLPNRRFLVAYTDYGNTAELDISDLKVCADDSKAADAEEAGVKLLPAPVRIADFGEQKEEKVVLVRMNEEGPTKKQIKQDAIERKKRELALKRDAERKKRAAARKLEAVQIYLRSVSERRPPVTEIFIDSFSLSTPDAGAGLLQDSDIRFVMGRRYGLIGRNGVGKTTLMRAISNYELPGFPTHLRVVHVEQEVTGDETPVLQYVLQSDIEREMLIKEEKKLMALAEELEKGVPPAESKFTQAERDAVKDPAQQLSQVYERLKEIDAWGAEARASGILFGLGFSSERQQMPTRALSGGWRMRVALACALFVSPDLLLLDEPTNHLDFPAVLWLEEYLQSYAKTIVIVSHDRTFVNNVITDVIHFHNKTLTYYRGDYETFEKVRHEQLTAQRRAHEAQQAKRAHIQKFVDKFRFNANRAALVQSRIKALARMELVMDVEDEAHFRFEFPEPEPLDGTIIGCRDVVFGYTADKVLLEDVACQIDMQSRVGIMGANGVGKSTLLNLLTGLLTPSSGEIIRNGHARITTFAQHHMDQLDLSLSPLEYMLQLFPKTHPQVMRRHLGCFGLSGDLATQRIGTLSGGQKSRVAFAVVTWRRPHLIIMDEPTNHLDIETIDALIVAVSNFGGGVLIVSHDQHFLSSTCTDFWGVSNKKMRRFDSLDAAKKFTYSLGR